MSFRWPDFYNKYKTPEEQIKENILEKRREFALKELTDFWLELDNIQKETLKELIKNINTQRADLLNVEPDVKLQETIYSKDGRKVGALEFKFKYEE